MLWTYLFTDTPFGWMSIAVTLFVLLYLLPLILSEIQTVVIYGQMRNPKGFEGQLKYPLWLRTKSYSVQLLGYSLFYLIMVIPAESAFLLGGAIGCLIMSALGWFRGRRLQAKVG